MALIGQGAWEVEVKPFDNATQTWPADFDPLLSYRFYSGQGFELPVDTAWINRPTGDDGTGMLMGFPRSAEPQPDQNGSVKWYVTES